MAKGTQVPADVMAQLWLSCFLLPALVVSVAANVPPKFLANMTAVILPEDLPVGAQAFWLVAEDQDNDSLTYGMSGPNAYFFTVTPHTGEVKLASPLDYETLYTFQVTISVSDGSNYRQKEMQVIVEDRNDNAPVFQNTAFSTSIDETLPVGSVVFSVLAQDKDTGSAGVVVYTIEKVIPSTGDSEHLFSILANGSIVLNGSLSYNNKSAFYQLELKACDMGGMFNNSFVIQCSVPVLLSISVVDQPDLDPQFVREFYSASVAEDAAKGTSVLKVEAVDGDKGINDPVIYSISNSTKPGWFDIGADGVIRVNGFLDREELLEEGEEVQLQVTATETHLNIHGQEAKVSTWVTVSVTDVNDHIPEFYNCSLPACTFTPEEAQVNFTGYVDEHASPRIPIDDLTMVVYDPDKAGVVAWAWAGGSWGGQWEPGSSAGVMWCWVAVLVVQGVVMEKGGAGCSLETCVGKQCHPLGNPCGADRKVCSSQLAGGHQTVTHLCYVEAQGKHHPGLELGREGVRAHDNDEPGTNNSRLLFSLLPGPYNHNFSLDPDTGLLRNLGPLDREAIDPTLGGRIVLTVLVSDCGEPVLTTKVNVTITVEDINDNLPIFNQSSYKFMVKEEDPGMLVGVVKAWDADQTEANNRISFSLSGSGANNFMIRGLVLGAGWAEGYLWLPPDVSLDFETQSVFNLTVSAENPDPQGGETTVYVLVNVEDVNDNPPTLDGASLRGIHVAENGSQHGQVAVVVASDVDTKAQLEIQLVNILCTKAGVDVGSLCWGWFSVAANGSVYINQSKAIDYEACDLVTLVVRACDLTTDAGFQAYSNNGSLFITIEDVNDNAPYFLPEDKTFVIIPELVLPNREVASVRARDYDSGNNGVILFSILQVDFISKDGATIPFQGFGISTSSEADVFTGSIQPVTSLDSTLQGTYQVTVQARDRPSVGPSLETNTTLNLFTVDQSYRVRLQFSTPREEVGANRQEINAALTQATRTTVYIVDIQDIDSAARARANSYLDAYFVFPNGTALTLDELSLIIRSDQDSLTQLLRLGLVVLGTQESQESDPLNQLISVIIGLGVALLLVLVIMTTAFVCVRKSYNRKIRAMKAAKEARKTAAGVMPSALPIPGTNMYNTERANPMLNLPNKDLGLEYLSSSSDLDYVSLNSLDDNSVDVDKNSQEIKEMCHRPPPLGPDPEPLTVVLSGCQADVSRQQLEELSYTNAGLDTTDL
ncbi:cadherin-related family member 2 [Sapajus apella]|uniref:Cadherin-related family member 2 n=1 Tax=Sapajus apella TaxID=9515 RepID=A0A6J3HCU8_SAPAP|nr:cadherin-related family member 2 [Sapajus apella]